MKIQELASRLAKLEGKKSQVKIGDMREILAILSDVVYHEMNGIVGALYENGKRRAKRKKLPVRF